MKKSYFYQGMFYLIGLLLLAVGLTLNTKSDLGVSPIISVSFCISTVWHLNFGDVTLALYITFVIVEMILHAGRTNRRAVLFMDFLQIPLSLIFTRFLNLFSALIPDLQTTYADSFAGSFAGRMIFLIIALILTGTGAAMSLDMRLVPNPGDGIVQAIADRIGKDVGFTKNCFDLFNVLQTLLIGLLFTGHITGIGIGTIMAMIIVGRVIAVFNHFFADKMYKLAFSEVQHSSAARQA